LLPPESYATSPLSRYSATRLSDGTKSALCRLAISVSGKRQLQIRTPRGQANCIGSLGDIALACSDHDTARQRYDEALALFRRVGSVLGQANYIRRLGKIALARSDRDTARKRYEEALGLYEHIQESYSTGWTHRLLADIARNMTSNVDISLPPALLGKA
jgi:tetratricopeptide (TPR) repeat protein